LGRALTDPITMGIIFGLVLGKPIGILLTTKVLATVTRANLDSSLRWVDVLGVSMLAGIGFTVSLLIGDLAYGLGSERDEFVKIGVLSGSLLAAGLASVLLLTRNATYRRICSDESVDDNADGVPDVYESRQD
ncbi:MAG: Na+/H+ antiporter NhaA, partial [Actinomycetota bacterium]|nr:Na+/H+ antiporter NhaA [Actinomycetota bacterium]